MVSNAHQTNEKIALQMILFKLNASVTKLLFIDIKSITHTKNYLVTISEILLPIFMFCFLFHYVNE